jgi:hypothetical protein
LSDSQAHVPAWETFGSGSFTARDFSGLSVASYAAGAAAAAAAPGRDDGSSAFAGFPSTMSAASPTAGRGGTSLPLTSRRHSVDCGSRQPDHVAAVLTLGSPAAATASRAGDDEPPVLLRMPSRRTSAEVRQA